MKTLKKLISENIDALHRVAEALLEHETITGEELDRIVYNKPMVEEAEEVVEEAAAVVENAEEVLAAEETQTEEATEETVETEAIEADSEKTE
jgi:hypothetical protein